MTGSAEAKQGLFAAQRDDIDDWTNEHQYLHSLLWSCFLDLDSYPAGLNYKRYQPYETAFAIETLLNWQEKSSARARLRNRFLDLAVWNAAPRFFGQGPDSADGAKAAQTKKARSLARDRANVRRLYARFREEFATRFQLDLAASRPEIEPGERSLLPPTLEPSIEDVRAEVVASRRIARIRVAANVQVDYEDMLGVLAPGNWTACSYLALADDKNDVEISSNDGSTRVETSGFKIRLPGGDEANRHSSAPDDVTSKVRTLDVNHTAAWSPFSARVDYQAFEVPIAAGGKVRNDSSAKEVEIDRLSGYFAVDKARGRPGWTTFTAERTVQFASFNHDRYRVETLQYWAAVEIISLVEACQP